MWPGLRFALQVLLVTCAPIYGRDVSVAVFTLFHPTRLEVAAAKGEPVTVDQTGGRPRTLNWPDSIVIDGPAHTTTPAHFIVRIRGRIERRFFGRLTVVHEARELIPIVTTDLETAVASVVAAESPPGSPPQSLRAQAVVARSFLLASARRHPHSDFCDTTHCQFLRDAPPRESPSGHAASDTDRIVLRYDRAIVQALYSADCGGRTRTLADARLPNSAAYPYFAVDCPVRDAPVSGHRIGLCQRGAAAMARSGASWRDILRHYFPGAVAEPN